MSRDESPIQGDAIGLRPAGPDDVYRMRVLGMQGWETAYSSFVHAHNRRSYLNGEFWSIGRLRAVIEDPDAINLVAIDQDRIIGFITTERLTDGRYEVTRLYVEQAERSRGVGAQLLNEVFASLRRCGVEEVLVNAFGDNIAGRRFYERHGFALIEDTWTRVGDQTVSDVWYALRLDPSRPAG